VRAALRWIGADLRSHRVASLLVLLSVAGTVAALLLAGTLLNAAFNPWERDFRSAHAPDLRIDTAPTVAVGRSAGLPRDALSHLPGVSALSAEQPYADVTLVGRPDQRLSFTLRADVPGGPRPLLGQGAWLRPGGGRPGSGEVVLERTGAEAAWVHLGDEVTVTAPGATAVQLRVIGIADAPDQVSYERAGYGLGWVGPATLDRVQPVAVERGSTVGFYLSDPATVDYTAQRAVTDIGSGRVARLSTWKEARDSQQQGARLAGLLLGLSGLGALLAAALAVAGAAGARTRARQGDMALLKALGFARSQIVAMFLLEHLLLAGGGSVLGALCAALSAPAFGTSAVAGVLDPGVTTAVTAAALAVIGLAAALPAYRAGGSAAVPPEADAATDTEAPARLLWPLRRLPAAAVLGLTGALRRPRARLVSVSRTALPVLACTLALSAWATVDAFGPGGAGAMDRTVVTVRDETTGPAGSDLADVLARLPQQRGVYPSAQLQALAPGQSATLTLRASGTSANPFPYTVVQGRGIRATDEAVAGQAALDMLDVEVGQWVRITTQGTPRILHIVGRSLDPELGGEVVSTGWDTLNGAGDRSRPAFYTLVLRRGSSAAEVRRALASAGRPDLDVRPAQDSLADAGGLRWSAIGLLALLAVILTAELLSVAGTIVRERRPQLGVLRAIGMTPRQVVSVLMVQSTAVALGGVVLGLSAGLPSASLLINAEGRHEGVGWGIARLPETWTLALLALVVALGMCLCLLPTTRLVRTMLPPRH
jgi:putative ABC transport system permease protein